MSIESLLMIILALVTVLLIGIFWLIRHIYGLNRTLIVMTVKRDEERNDLKREIKALELQQDKDRHDIVAFIVQQLKGE